MPLYFFIVTQGDNSSLDEEGLEFTDLDAAWEEATKAGGQWLRDLDGSLKVGDLWSIQVLDESKKLLRRLVITAEETN